MADAFDHHDAQARRIREWLLLLLRFAITREPGDRCAALAMAHEIDTHALRWTRTAPTFFRRTSGEVLHAIVAVDDPGRRTVLERHLGRIDDARLRRAFRAAAELDPQQQPRRPAPRHSRLDLWVGLQR